MSNQEQLQLFEGLKIRTIWNDEKEKWYFSIVDVVRVLTDSNDPKQYIKKMKMRDTELQSNWGTICTLVQMKGDDGKNREQMTADIEGILRIIYLFAAGARRDFEERIGHSIISPQKAIDNTVPAELLPFNESEENSDFFEEKV